MRKQKNVGLRQCLPFCLRALCLAAVVAFSLAITACGNKEDVAAKVDDAAITQDLVDGVAAFTMYYLNGQAQEGAGQEATIWSNQVLVYMCVQTEMFRLHFEKEGKVVIDADADAEIEDAITAFLAQAQITDADMPGLGFTRSDMKYYFEHDAYYEAYVAETAESDSVTDEEARAFYDANQSAFGTLPKVRASHILINDPGHTPEKRAEIEDILAKAKAGEDFGELAKEYSEDGSAENGGDLDYFGTGDMAPEFEAAAFALEVDGISDIVETEFGYHIIKLTGRQEESVQSFEEAKENIVSYLRGARASEDIENVLKQGFTIKYFVDVDPETGEPPLSAARLDALSSASGEGG